MKINVEVECTPEDARRFMGLPDLTPLHDRYLAKMADAIDQGGTPEGMEAMLRSWAPMGEAGLNFWRGLLESGTKSGS